VNLLEDNKKLYVLGDYGNAANIFNVFEKKKDVRDVLDAMAAGEIEALICLGADVVSSAPGTDAKGILGKLKCLVVSAPFNNATTALSPYVLPEAIWLEKDGTYTRGTQTAAVAPIGAAQSYTGILESIAKAMGKELAVKELPARKTGGAPGKADVGALVKAALEDDFSPLVRSTAKKFSDGSLTDNMSWYVLSEERVQ
jgi:anaerobic selenocysteine-containing dehydrogenase